jgi:hypothetical protein
MAGAARLGPGVDGACVGPLREGGLDEALGLAVGLGCVGLGADVLELQPFAGAREGAGFVAGAVVGHDAGDLDAEAIPDTSSLWRAWV